MKTSCSTNTTSLPDGLTTSQQLCRIQSDEVGFVKGNTVMPESLRDLVARQGVHVAVAARMLGHDITTMLRLYTAVQPDHLKTAADAMDRVLEG